MNRPAAVGTILLAALSGAGAASRPAGTVSIAYAAMTLSVPTTLVNAKNGSRLTIVGGSAQGGARFGVAFDGAKAANEPVLELRDASTNTVLRTVTVGELLGRPAPGWKPLAGTKNDSVVVARFQFGAGETRYTLSWNVRRLRDAHLPSGTGIAVSFGLAANRAGSVRARFLGAVAGTLRNDPNGCVIADSATGAAIAVAAGRDAAFGAAASPSRFTLESGTIALSPSQQTPVLSFTAAGTTAPLPAQAETQARNTLAYLRTDAAAPQLVAMTTVDRTSPSRGDTVTYRIEYCNVGADAGAAMELHNPIPRGAAYVEDSAEGAGTEVNVVRTDERVPQSVSWRFLAPIAPGDRRSVSFKVIVR